MKKTYLFIALAMVAAMTVSCKNNRKAAKNAEANAEVVAAAKTILADDVLATLDEISQTFFDGVENFDVQDYLSSCLTDEEKMIKPDYLLDPAKTNDLVTKSQKVSALAILLSERPLRVAYGMPVEEAEKAIARLVAELNHPLSIDDEKDVTPGEKAKRTYESCKENGEIAYFWQLMYAFQTEYRYLFANDPEPFFRNITDVQVASFYDRLLSCDNAINKLAKYDEEMALVAQLFMGNKITKSQEEAKAIYSSKESAKQHYIDNKDNILVQRNALLK